MSDIEWTQRTWNPMVGCSKVSPGCKHCYAMSNAPHRFTKPYERAGVVRLNVHEEHDALTYLPEDADGRSLGKGAQWTGEVRLLPHVLEVPLRRRKPTTYFVNSLSDLFHEAVADSEEGRRFIAAVFGVMAACPQHTFQILTKRPHKAREWFDWLRDVQRSGPPHLRVLTLFEICWVIAKEDFSGLSEMLDRALIPHIGRDIWPLPNVWVGTSVENQDAADKRIPDLLRIPAAVRFLSCEPLLGWVSLDGLAWWSDLSDGSVRVLTGVDWVIVGGESGPKSRSCEVNAIRKIVNECKSVGVPVFVKQLGAMPIERCPLPRGLRLKSRKGNDPDEWPEDLRVRQMPETP